MKKSLLACLLAAGMTTGALQAQEPFPIQFIALGGNTQTVPSDDYDQPFDAATIPSASDAPAGDYQPEYRKPRQRYVPTNYAQASGLLMHRVSTGADRALVAQGVTSALETSDLDALTGGFQATIGWQLFGSAHHALELSYFGLYDWSESATLTSPANNLSVVGVTSVAFPNFSLASAVDVDYSSDLYNAEFNYVRSFYYQGAKIDFLSGFRYVHLDENLGITADNTTAIGSFPLVPGIGTYDVDVRNNLFGHQIGGRYSRPLGRWSLQTVGKAGVFLNDASSSQSLTDVTLLGPVAVASESDRRSVAALGELGIFGRRQLTDTWALRVGYQATGIGGVALATNQTTPLELSTSAGIDTDGFFFMHGGVFGLEAAW